MGLPFECLETISSLNLLLVICILRHPWLLFSSLVFTCLMHFQTANTARFCFCFARLNKSFPSISYCKAGSLFCWSFSPPFSASASSNSPFCKESDQNYVVLELKLTTSKWGEKGSLLRTSLKRVKKIPTTFIPYIRTKLSLLISVEKDLMNNTMWLFCLRIRRSVGHHYQYLV